MEQRTKEKGTYAKGTSIVVGVIIITAYLCLVAWAFRDMKKSFYVERTEKTHMLMGKITQNIETAIQSEWDSLHQFIAVFQHHKEDVTTLEETLEELARIKEEFSKEITTISLVDSNAVCYYVDGQTNKSNRQELLASGKDECYISSSEVWVINEGASHLFFLSPLKEKFVTEGITFTHMMLVVEMSAFDEYFDTSEFGESSVAFIIRNTGGQVYRQEKENPISGVLNVLTALSRAQFNFDASLEQMKEEIRAGVGNCINLNYEGIEYDVAYEPLSMNEWVALLMVPSEASLSGTRSFMNSIILTTVILALATLFIVIIVLVNSSTHINAQLQKAVEAEKSANDAKTRFLSSMSHDIRTPMNAIIGMTNLAMKNQDDPEYVQNCLTKVAISSNHLLTLINDVLDISKVESGKMALNPGAFSLTESMSYMINVVMPQIREKNQSFEIIVHELPQEEVYADQLRVNQIIINLLSNAMKYTQVGGDIRVELFGSLIKEKPGMMRVVYKVADNGMGMTEEFQKNMYNSFEREDTKPHSSIQGSGLGLAICKQMVTLMGGTIDCVSEVGVGTTFTVTVDLALAEQKTLEPLPALKVLLVDRSEEILSEATEKMRALGITVESTSEPENAVQRIKAQKNGYDFAIADIDSAEIIRLAEGLEDFPVLVSDYDSELLGDSSRKDNAAGFVHKPYFTSGIHRDISKYLCLHGNASREEAVQESLAGTRILIAEDNEFNWEIAQEILRLSQVETVRASNGKECVELINEAEDGAFDLILMDIQMPIMNGYEATKAIRASEREYLRTIPIIAMTADAFAEDIQRCFDIGMNGHIAKPIEEKKLFEVIRKKSGGVCASLTDNNKVEGGV